MRLVLVLIVIAGCSAPVAPQYTPPKWVEDTGVQVPPLADPEVPGFRLPGDVRPVRVALDMTIVPAEATAAGKVTIEARVVRPTSVVWMHAQDLKIGKATINGVEARVIQKADLLGLVAPKELMAGEVKLEIAYVAPIDKEKSRGLYSEKEAEQAYAYTFFEAIDARRAFPCFDEPSYKVPWKLTFHVREDQVARGNAAVVKETPERGGMKRVELAESKPLPSYLVAFVVGPFEVIDGGTGGRANTPIHFIIPKGRGSELGWAKQVTPRVVAALETYFDMDYPFGKLDVAVVPRFWGTMEHPGIVAMGQPLTLIRPDQETRSRKLGYANILAHELGHYWFGDYVTMTWWDDTWLNEGLGQWLDMIITDAVEPGWRYRDERVWMGTDAMRADETLSAQRIRQPVTTTEGIQASFDGSLVYMKGSSVFRMFESYVGVPKWQEFIREYLKAHAWGNASAEDFLGKAKQKLGGNIEAGLRSFLEQPGVPRVKIGCTLAGQAPDLTLEQTRALPTGTVDDKPKIWRFPVCMRYGTAQKSFERCVELADGKRVVPLDDLATCPTWIIPNAGSNGYYRSSIDPAIATALLTPGSAIARIAKPTAAERMRLVDDLVAAVDRDELTIDKRLALASVLIKDPDDKVARYAFAAAALRHDALDDALFAKAIKFNTKTFGERARKLGWKRAASDSSERNDLRRELVPAIATRDPQLAREANKLADEWLAKRSGVDDELVSGVLATAAFTGNQARFDQLVEAAKHPRDRNEQQRLLGALGGFRDPAIATKAFELVLGKDFDLRDSLAIVYGVLGGRETRALGWKLVQTHIDAILGRMRDDEASWFFGALAGGACDPTLRAQVAELLTARARKFDGAQAAVARGLEQSDQCIRAMARQLPAVRSFLANY